MLQNESIYLRVIEESDVANIQCWHNDYDTTKYTTLTSFTPRNFDEEQDWYRRKLTDGTSRIFMIDEKETAETVGFVSYSNLDYRNQKALLSIVIGNTDFRGKGIATQAIQLLEDLLKNEFNVRKVTVQVLSNNDSSLSLFERSGYMEEGILKKEIYRNGKFHDLHLLSKFI